MYELVLFDLDGTLVNSLDDLANACNEALKKFGYPCHDREKYRYFVGNGIPKLIERVLPEGKKNEEEIARVKAEFDRIYGLTFDKLTRPYDGIPQLLDGLAEMGVMTAVLSNKADEFSRRIIDRLFEHRFDLVLGKKDGFGSKPDPAGARYIMDTLGTAPGRTLIAGDSSVDMQTACNAGCDSVGCTWGFREQRELEENHAVYIAHSPSDILNIVRKNNQNMI